MIQRRRVVVTGLGVVSSLGLSVTASWEKALTGISGVRVLSYPGSGRSPIRAVGAVTDVDIDQITSLFPRAAQTEGERRTLFALWAVHQAITDSKLTEAMGNRQRFGVSMAAGLGINRLEDIDRWLDADNRFEWGRFAREFREVHSESIIRNNSDRPAALIARQFSLGGPNCTVTTACASATQALGIAYRMIRRGEADVMVAGGADSMINPVGLIFFVLLGAASLASDDPATVCRPFDRRRSGLVMGEGAGIAVLEEAGHALARGAVIYGEVTGYGASMDGYQITAPHPQGRGAAQAMRAALADAAMDPTGIDYINAHGTGTKLNDLAETLAIKAVFGQHSSRLAISSSKSLIGHLLAGSGGPEFVFTVLSVSRDEIHPTINLTHPDPKLDLDYVPNTGRKATVRAALSNSFGFGGQNGSIIVRKFESNPAGPV